MSNREVAVPAPCPEWCRREHDIEDRTGEEDHTTEATWLPVVILLRDWSTTPRALQIDGTDLIVEVVQPEDAAEPWLSIGEAEGHRIRAELSIESAHRLMRAMARQLSQL